MLLTGAHASSSVNDYHNHDVNIPTSPTADGQQLLPQPSDTSSSPTSEPPTPLSVEYPSIGSVLRYMHNFLPYYNMPQYEVALLTHGIKTVSDVRTASKDLLAKVGMSDVVQETFMDWVMRDALITEGHGVSVPRL
jgi:hypothetical protein